MRICVAGAAGAFGLKHLDALKAIEDVTVTCIVDHKKEALKALADEHNINHYTTSLDEALARDDVDAVILATPTPMHAQQAIQCLEAGKHVEVEIPMADNIEEARRLVETQPRTGLVAMAGHTRRFNPSHQWMFQYQTGQVAEQVQAMQGPMHPSLNIAMDMSIGMKVPNGALCTLSLSFNNNGPFGTFFRYICDNGTYIARYDDLFDGNEKPINLSGVTVSNNGIELQDREFIASIREGREPNASVAQCLPAMETLYRLEQALM
ncbi:MAG: Gfo/Idh/MocA family oxidoreductase [Reinekea sp.]